VRRTLMAAKLLAKSRAGDRVQQCPFLGQNGPCGCALRLPRSTPSGKVEMEPKLDSRVGERIFRPDTFLLWDF
jgi:hypothetical protein